VSNHYTNPNSNLKALTTLAVTLNDLFESIFCDFIDIIIPAPSMV